MGKVKRQAVVEELKNLAALHAREIVMSTKADGMKTEGQIELMYKVYHGSAGYASTVSTMMDGKAFYAAVFDKLILEVNRQGNEERKNGVMLEIKQIYHSDEGRNTHAA